MTGFGHFTFFYKKGDFSLPRIAKVIVRLNLLSVALSYVMTKDTLFYYFGPLVTFWFLVVYWTMAILPSWNQHVGLLMLKMALSLGIALGFIGVPGILEGFFDFMYVVFGTEWNAKESRFRLMLDPFAVHGGMIVAFITAQIQDKGDTFVKRIMNRLGGWSIAKKAVSFLSFVVVISYGLWLIFGSFSKSDNNQIHPYTSVFVLVGFIVLRNVNEAMRKTTSVWFRWVGTFSLETFLLQYHLWLAVDTRGLLVVLPGMFWLNMVLTTILFFATSEAVGAASGVLVDAIVSNSKSSIAVAIRLFVLVAIMAVWNHI
jgi:hypothetical protein